MKKLNLWLLASLLHVVITTMIRHQRLIHCLEDGKRSIHLEQIRISLMPSSLEQIIT